MEARAELVEPLGLKPAEVLIGEHPVGHPHRGGPHRRDGRPRRLGGGQPHRAQAQVVGAAAAGLMAGAAINFDLILDETGAR